jgi:replicative DNA helicase
MYQKREIIDIAKETVWQGMSNGVSAEDFLDETLQKFFALTGTTGRTAERLGDGAVSDYLTILSNPQPPPRLSWPWPSLDKILHGLRPGEMTVIGGRPGSGKTALAMNLALDLGMTKRKPVGIFSLEMSKLQLINRMLAQLATVDSSELQDAKISPEQWERVLEGSIKLSEATIWVDDDSSLSEVDLVSKTRKMKYQHDIGCVVLDYLQLLKGSGRSGNREQEVSGFAQTAKRIARDLDIAVVVLSSLNRGPEFREDHRPMISDFRESGGIENEADVILGLYRDYYYNPNANPQDAEIIVLKQRNGPTGTVKLKFEKKYTMFWSEE